MLTSQHLTNMIGEAICHIYPCKFMVIGQFDKFVPFPVLEIEQNFIFTIWEIIRNYFESQVKYKSGLFVMAKEVNK